MLREIRVRDVVVIRDVRLVLNNGLNVLTGETGAGKSMLIDSLSLLLGERASSGLVRAGAKRAVVEAAFENLPEAVLEECESAGVDVDEGRLIFRREISREGRNRAWLNGSPATVGVLTRIGAELVDMHGQHETQSLLKPNIQRDILDRYAGAEPQRVAVRSAYARLKELTDKKDDLSNRLDEVTRRADYLRHVAEEIGDASIEPGEDEQLDEEASVLSNAEEIITLSGRIDELLDGEDSSVSGTLGTVSRILDDMSDYTQSVEQWHRLLDSATAELGELARSVREFAAGVELDPARLKDVQERRDLIYRLKKKYGTTIEAVLETARSAADELDLLDSGDFDADRLDEMIESATVEYVEAAGGLARVRRVGASRLSEEASRLLPRLGLPDAELKFRLTPLDAPAEHGSDRVSIVVRLNKGMDEGPLKSVASGGELSRVMLVLKVVLANADRIPTLVFDEVDQGVGGEVAVALGECLAEVSSQRQVLVITHLPQIASEAHHHLMIEKSANDGVATSSVRSVEADERVTEVARMLGSADDETTLQLARKMLG